MIKDLDNIEYSIVIPVFNSGNILPVLIGNIVNYFKELNYSFEILLVDDHSNDNTWEVICSLSKEISTLKSIKLNKNIGQFEATLLGISKSKGKYIINMDDDMEHPPSEIGKLISKIKSNNEFLIVFGMSKDKYVVKGIGEQIPRLRNNILNILWGKYQTDSFRIFKRELVFDGNTFLPKTIILEAYLKHYLNKKHVGYVEVERNRRFGGNSNFGIIKKIKFLIKLSPYFIFKR